MVTLMNGGRTVARMLAYALPIVAVLCALAVRGPVAAPGGPEDRAREFIESLAEQAIEALAKADVSQSEREVRFREMLNENFAVSDIGRWVLGRHWSRATPEEQAEYLSLFEDQIVGTYVRRFTRYSGETLSVGRGYASDEGGDVLVDSQIVRPGSSEPVNIGWRVRSYENGPKIVDVIVEGVSMGQTQRSEYGSVIRRNGGTVAGLISEMRRVAEAQR